MYRKATANPIWTTGAYRWLTIRWFCEQKYSHYKCEGNGLDLNAQPHSAFISFDSAAACPAMKEPFGRKTLAQTSVIGQAIFGHQAEIVSGAS